MKKYILICYFVFYRYYSKLDRKYDPKNKNTWRSALIVSTIPYTILSMLLFLYLLNLLPIKIPGPLFVLSLCGLSYFLISRLLFKIYNIDKHQDVSQQTEITLNKYSFVYPLIIYVVVIAVFLTFTYLRNGYIIKS